MFIPLSLRFSSDCWPCAGSQQRPTPRCGGATPDSSQSEAARNDSRGVFGNSKLRPSSTKDTKNLKTISFNAREPSATATLPMKTWLSPNACCSPGKRFICSWNVAETTTEEKIRSVCTVRYRYSRYRCGSHTALPEMSGTGIKVVSNLLKYPVTVLM